MARVSSLQPVHRTFRLLRLERGGVLWGYRFECGNHCTDLPRESWERIVAAIKDDTTMFAAGVLVVPAVSAS